MDNKSLFMDTETWELFFDDFKNQEEDIWWQVLILASSDWNDHCIETYVRTMHNSTKKAYELLAILEKETGKRFEKNTDD